MQKEKEQADKRNVKPNPYIAGFKQSVPEGIGYGIIGFFLIHSTKKLVNAYTSLNSSEKDKSDVNQIARSNSQLKSKL